MKNRFLFLLLSAILSFTGYSQTTLTGNVYGVKQLVTEGDTTAVQLMGRRKSDGRFISVAWEKTQGVTGVTGDAVDNTDPKNPSIYEKKDLPEGFFISSTVTELADPNFGRYATYLPKENIGSYTASDLKQIDLLPLLPNGSILYRAMGVFVEENIYFKTKLNDITGNFGLIALYKPYIQDGILKWESSEYQEFPEILRSTSNVAYNLHSELIIGDFIYLVSRTEESGATNPTQIVKINKNDISQYTVYSLPTTTGLLGSVADAKPYGDYIYMLSRQSQSGAYVTRIDKDLTTPEALFPYGNISGSARPLGSSPMVIDQDLIYIPTRYNFSTPAGYPNNRFGIEVYSITTNKLVASNPSIEISTGVTEGGVIPHWMSMYEGKLFVHTATSTADSNKRLVRINPKTLLLDGPIDTGVNVASVNIGYLITNNNTISPDGWITLNPEGGVYDKPLKRYRTNDLSIQETILPTGYYSTGSPEYRANPIKAKTSLSQFGEWNKVTQSVSINGGTPVTPDPATGNINLTISSGGGATNLTYSASPTNGTVNSDTGTDATIPAADSTNAGLLLPAEKNKITNVPTDTNASLALKANLSGGNTFSNDQTFGGNVIIGNTMEIRNSSGPNRFTLNVGGASSSGYIIRNINDAEPAFAIGNINSSSSGDIFQGTSSIGGTTATRAGIRKDGRVYGTNATATNDFVTLQQLAVMNAYSAKTASYTLTASDYCVDLTANSATFTLPSAVGIAGKQYVIKNSGSGTVLTLATTSSQTIDGTTTKTFNTQYAGIRVISDGANWKIIGTY